MLPLYQYCTAFWPADDMQMAFYCIIHYEYAMTLKLRTPPQIITYET